MEQKQHQQRQEFIQEAGGEAGGLSTGFYLTLVLTLIILIVSYLITKKLKKSTNICLFTGLSDSGKTAIFTNLVYHRPKKSVTSLKENIGQIADLNLKVIDIPGADRLRGNFWEQYRSKANHVVFMIDSTTLDDKLRELSEYLYTLLSDNIIYKNRIRFTIACNKQDLEGAKKSHLIRALLEKELNAIRATKKGQLAKTSNEEEDDYLLKADLKELTLDKLKVNVIETTSQDTSQLIKLMF